MKKIKYLFRHNILCDSSRNWICRFQGYIGAGSAQNAELWAIFHGMETTQQCGHKKIIVETYCMMALEMIQESMGSTPSITIVRRIKT